MSYRPASKKFVIIYALVDPRTGETRYVGCSKDPIGRLELHWYDCKHTNLVLPRLRTSER